PGGRYQRRAAAGARDRRVRGGDAAARIRRHSRCAGGRAGHPAYSSTVIDEWPDLPYEPWRPTRDTLHMYAQVVGRLRLALSPFEPQWANVPLYVTARGLTTSPLPVGPRTFDAELDLFDHALVLRSSDGGQDRVPLGGPVADFYGSAMEALRAMGVA